MSEFFFDQKPTAGGGLNLLVQNDYRDIHLATLNVLEKTGVFVEDQHAQEVFGSYGAKVDKKKKIIKLPSGLVEDAIQSAPGQVMLAGRNPDHDILLENHTNAYLNFPGGINVIDPHTRMVRESTKADLAASARLCDGFKVGHLPSGFTRNCLDWRIGGRAMSILFPAVYGSRNIIGQQTSWCPGRL